MLGFVLDWQGQVLMATGAVDEARRALQEAVEIAAPWTQLASRGRLAVLDASDGRTESARAQIHRCVEILEKGNGWRGSLGLVARARGALAAAEGRMDDAGNAFSDAAQTSARHGFPWEEANTLQLWGRALLDAREPSSAIEKFDAALEIYRKHGAGPRWAQRVLVDRARAE
jgi:tetratricopeptide (TPR) repeat protein